MYYYKLLIKLTEQLLTFLQLVLSFLIWRYSNMTGTLFLNTTGKFSIWRYSNMTGTLLLNTTGKFPTYSFLLNRSGHIIVLILSVPITYIMAYEYLRPLLIVTRSFNTCSGFISYNPSQEINNNRYCRLTYFYNMSSTLHVYVQITAWCLGAYKNIRELIKIILRLYFVYALVMSVLFIKQQEFYYQYKCVYFQSKYFSKHI